MSNSNAGYYADYSNYFMFFMFALLCILALIIVVLLIFTTYIIFRSCINKCLYSCFYDWCGLNICGLCNYRKKRKYEISDTYIVNIKNDKPFITFKGDNIQKTSISVVCSRWEEPFGRTSLESASCGCAVIITNRGGLPETITNGVILKNLSKKSLYDAISKLIKKTKYRGEIQRLSLRNFNLTHKNASIEIDNYRNEILLGSNSNKNSLMTKIKILHVTNFNERHNGRLFYNTGKRINNGFVRLNHSVLEFSDRDIVSYYRKLNDINGSKKLNKKFIEVISNYLPDLIVFGHADLIKRDTIKFIKSAYPNIKFCQWFLDRMDGEWSINLKRFKDKLDLVDFSFCTTNPKELKIKELSKVKFRNIKKDTGIISKASSVTVVK